MLQSVDWWELLVRSRDWLHQNLYICVEMLIFFGGEISARINKKIKKIKYYLQ
jgi:hypothetical protein